MLVLDSDSCFQFEVTLFQFGLTSFKFGVEMVYCSTARRCTVFSGGYGVEHIASWKVTCK